MTRDFTLLFSNLSLYSISRRIRIIRFKKGTTKNLYFCEIAYECINYVSQKQS